MPQLRSFLPPWLSRTATWFRSRSIASRETVRTLMRRTAPLADHLRGAWRTGSARLRTRPALYALAIVGALKAALILYVAADVVRRLPDPQDLSTLDKMPQATVIYDAFDRRIFNVFHEQRQVVRLEQMSRHLIDAVLAIEDRRFYRHHGIDVIRVGGATLANLTAGRVVQGGSTITQQLARQSLLTRERTIQRKLAEMVTALQIEFAYDKRQILELYLNRIYFGSGFYGAEVASRGYFGKPAAELTVGEATLLAGLIQAPERYSPFKFPERAADRRAVVLRAMLDTGALDEATFETTRDEPVKLNPGLQPENTFAWYFKEAVRQQLVDLFGFERVYEDGLRVYTTIDPRTQQAAEQAIERGAQRIEARKGYLHPKRTAALSSPQQTESAYLQGALIALDPRTGEVRALVGGRSFVDSPFNRAIQARRQPGSAFKPFIFAAALEAGIPPSTVLRNLYDPFATPEGDWLPADGHVDASELTLRRALRVSSNRAAVQLLRLTGVDRALDSVSQFGLGPQPAVPSLALGPGEVTLEMLTAAYAAFAADGLVPRPLYIRRVDDAEGREIFSATAMSTRAVSRAAAFQIATMLADVVDSGTGYRVRSEGFDLPAGGKTGTTNDSVDAWFVGFTPGLAAGVWMGLDERKTIIPNGYAADLAAPVWADFMKSATRTAKREWLARPPEVVSVEICALSGALASDACRRSGDEHGKRVTYVEHFVRGTEPIDTCREHDLPAFFRLLSGVFGHSDRDAPATTEVRPPIERFTGGGGGPNNEGAPHVTEAPTMPEREVAAGAEVMEEPKSRKRFWRKLIRLGF